MDTTFFTYRRALLSDLDALKELGIVSYGQYEPVLGPVHFAQLDANLRNAAKQRELFDSAACFVCLDGERIVGMAYLVPKGNPWDVFEPDWSYIRMVGVHPEYSGRGIARALTAQCIDHARQSGEKTIALHTSEFMNAARHIYESLGFTVLREIPERLGKRYWLYTLAL